MAGRTSGRTPISSGETPTRERSADHRRRRVANTSQRELIQDILGPDPSTSSSRSVAPARSLSVPSSQGTVVSPTGGTPVSTSATGLQSNPGSETRSETRTASVIPGSKYVAMYIMRIMSYHFSDVSLEIRRLQEQQKKLAASSSRIENMLKALTSEHHASPRDAVPQRELSVSFNYL